MSWRRLKRTDPQEAAELWLARYELAKEQYMTSAISHDCFVASLYALGFRNGELESERRLAEHRKFELTGSCD